MDGSKVAYWTYEPVTVTPLTRTILVIHGFRGGDHHGLLRVADQLPGMRIIMPDLPAFGSSEPFVHDEHSVERYGKFISGFMAALDLNDETVLLGHSFGSIVASHFVAANPGTVYPLILINPIAAPALEGPKGIMTKLAVLYYQASAKLPPRQLGLAVLRNRVIVRIMSITMAKTKDRAFVVSSTASTTHISVPSQTGRACSNRSSFRLGERGRGRRETNTSRTPDRRRKR